MLKIRSDVSSIHFIIGPAQNLMKGKNELKWSPATKPKARTSSAVQDLSCFTTLKSLPERPEAFDF